MVERGMRGRDLARLVGITEANLSLLRNGRVKGMRFETLSALCRHLDCQPGDLLTWEEGEEEAEEA